jgi:hypothetical protein
MKDEMLFAEKNLKLQIIWSKVEGMALALWDDDPAPLDLTGTYTKTARGYHHPDPRIQRVLELRCIRDALQAIEIEQGVAR